MISLGQRFFARSLALALALTAISFNLGGAQLSTTIRDRIIPAAVQIAILTEVSEGGQITESQYIPVGSGTVVSPDGLILTNWHVVDIEEHQRQLDTWENQAATNGERLTFDLDTEAFLILTPEDTRPPKPTYRAEIASHDSLIDLAVLRIIGDAFGDPIPTGLGLPYVLVGNSDSVELGDPIDIFGYPTAAGDSLTYTTGVVSGFNYDPDLATPLWINTDATISGGSSGGTAINGSGELVGIPTQGSALDCRPGDTNLDGDISADDVGCIPVGGSIGQLRPVNLAEHILLRAGALHPAPNSEPAATSSSEASPPLSPVPVDRWRLTLDGAAGYPVHESGIIYASSNSRPATGSLNAIDALSGQLLWSFPYTENITDPVFADGMMFIGGSSGTVYAWDLATGQQLWRFAGGRSPLPPVVAGGKVLLEFRNESESYFGGGWPPRTGEVLYALDAVSGQQLWQFATGTSLGEPVVSQDSVFVRSSSDSAGSEVFRIDANTGQIIWTIASSGEALPGTIQTDGSKVFIKSSHGGVDRGGSTTMSAIEVASGQELWQFTAPYWVDSLFLDDGLIVFQGYETEPEHRETLYVIDPNSGRERWHSSLDGLSSDPLVATGRVFFVGEGLLYALDATTGEQQWTLPVQEDWVTANVLADESGLYIGNDAGALYALDVR